MARWRVDAAQVHGLLPTSHVGRRTVRLIPAETPPPRHKTM